MTSDRCTDDRGGDASDAFEPERGVERKETVGPDLRRRNYLRGLAALGAGGALTGMASSASATTSQQMTDLFSQYGTVIDVVEAGADNTGNQSITPILDEHAADDTLLVFPPGTYYMDDEFRFCGFNHFGLVGNDATIVPADYYHFNGPNYRLFRLGVYHNPGTDLLVKDLTIDQTASDTGIRTIEAQVSDGLEVSNVTIDGKHDSGTWGPGLFDVMDPDGTGHVEGFRAPDGGEWVSNTPNDGNLWRGPTGIMVSRYHRGTVVLKDCELGGFPDNGIYAGNANGTVVVDGGTFKNSHASNVRLGGYHSRVTGATVVIDENPEHFTNQRAIRLDQGSWLQVEDVTIRLEKPNGNAISVLDGVESARIAGSSITISTDRYNHGIVVSSNAGPTYIQHTDIDMDTSGNALLLHGADGAGEIGVNYVNITGNASGRAFRNAIRVERDNCQFRYVTVDQPGSYYRRAMEIDADDCLVYKGSYKSTHHPIIVNDAGEWIQEIYDKYDRAAGHT
ncbi:MAG: hypothetical protein ABEJ28_08005 [Salinigranum sp.]